MTFDAERARYLQRSPSASALEGSTFFSRDVERTCALFFTFHKGSEKGLSMSVLVDADTRRGGS